MANLIKVLGRCGGQQAVSPYPVSVPVFKGAVSSIKPGMLVITDPVNPGFWYAAPTGTDTTTLINAGVAKSESTETVAVDGSVEIEAADVLLVQIKALDPTALTVAMRGVAWILSVVGGNYTLDQNTSANGVFNILDYDNIVDGNCTCLLTTHWRG